MLPFFGALVSPETMVKIEWVIDFFEIISPTEYYRVLQCITEYYNVLQSITKTNLAHLLGPIFGLVIFVGNGSSLPTHLRRALPKSHFSPRAYSSGVIFSFVESEDKDGDLSLGPIHHVQSF